MQIRIDPLDSPEIIGLLDEHMRDMVQASPPESVHALDIRGLREPDITFWSLWDGPTLAGCGALKELDSHHGEIKSMRTADAYRLQGVARRMLDHLIGEARRRGYQRLSLETGSMVFFEPAREFYAAAGFEYCAPFGPYVEDPNSVLMTLRL